MEERIRAVAKTVCDNKNAGKPCNNESGAYGLNPESYGISGNDISSRLKYGTDMVVMNNPGNTPVFKSDAGPENKGSRMVEMCKITDGPYVSVFDRKVEMVKYVNNSLPEKLPAIPEVRAEKAVTPVAEKIQVKMHNNDNEVFHYTDGKTYYFDTPVFNGFIEITGIVYGDQENYYKCNVCIKNTVKEMRIEISRFSKGNWVFGVPLIAFFVPRAKAGELLFLYLQYLIDKFDTRANQYHIYNKPGWYVIENRYMYITPDGAIGDTSGAFVSQYGQKFSSLVAGRPEGFRDYLKMVDITNTDTGAILVLYTAASLCYGLFKIAGFPLKWSVFLHGPRGNYKTSMALAMTQIQHKSSPEYTLKSTKSGLETAFKLFKDACFLVDDLAPVQLSSERRALQSNLELIVRMYGDGTGAKRNFDFIDPEKCKHLEQYVAEGGAVITGEYTCGCESSLARCMFLELKKDAVDLNLLSEIQSKKTMVSDFAVILIANLQYLLNEAKEDVIGYIRENVRVARAEYSGKFSNERYSEYRAQLLTIAKLLSFIANRFSLLSTEETNFYYHRFVTAIENTISYNSIRLIKESPLTVICNSLVDSIEDEKYPVINIKTIAGDRVIYTDDENIYLTQKLCSEITNNYMKENNIKLSEFTATRVADLLAEEQIIKVFPESKTVRKAKKFSGHGTARYMIVNKEKLYKNSKF